MGKRDKIARRLLDLGINEPQVPRQEVLKLTGEEEEFRGRVMDFAREGVNQDTQTALEQLRGIATGGDPTQLPEFQSVMDVIQARGDRSARGLGRSLRIAGNAPGASSKGRDVIGRKITDVQSEMTAAAVPFLRDERARQFQATGALADLASRTDQERLGKLNVGQNAAQMVRLIDQAAEDAKFNQAQTALDIRFNVQPKLLSGAFDAISANDARTSSLAHITNAAGIAKGIGSIASTGISLGGIAQGGMQGGISGLLKAGQNAGMGNRLAVP